MKCNKIANTFAIAALTAITLGIAPTAKADSKGCAASSIKGTFAYTATGFITVGPAPVGPFAEVGTQTFDGQGGTTASATLSANGQIIPITIKGTYTVNPDCTGTITMLVSPFGSTVHNLFVIAQNGNEFQALENETGVVISRIGRKQYPAGDWRE